MTSHAHIRTQGSAVAAEGGVDPIGSLASIWEYRWSVLSLTLASILIAGIAVMMMEPVYRATATLQIDPSAANVIEIDEVYETGSTAREYHKTQYEVLQSRQLIQRVIKDLQLGQLEYFQKELADEDEGFTDSLKRILSDVPGLSRFFASDAGDSPKSTYEERLFNLVTDGVDIAPVTGTYLVDVRFHSKNANISTMIANAIVDVYIKQARETRAGVTQEASSWLESRLQEAESKLRASEKALQSYMEEQKLLNVGGARSLEENELTENIRELREASAKRESLANVYTKIRAAGNNVELLQEIPAIQQEPLVHETKKAFLAAKESREELSSRYGPKHPKMISANARYDAARDAYHNQLRIRADGIRAEYELAAATVSSLNRDVSSSKNKIQNLDRNEHSLQVLKREVETNRELYNTFLTRYKETEATSDLQVTNASIVDRASVPREPHSPKIGLSLVLAGLLGLILGSVLALLRSTLDDTIRTTEDLEQYSSLPILGSLPLVSVKGKQAGVARLIVEEPKTLFAEGVRTLRTGIMLSDVDQKKQAIMVTSSVPQEGKTATSVNLALSMAQMEKTLLIDADLRSPSVGQSFALPKNLPGLTQAIIGANSLDQCIHSIEDYKLDILPAGQLPPNPSELLGSARFKSLLEQLKQKYDRIVIDTAPCAIVSDSLLLGRAVDGAIFVVRADETSRRVVRSAVHHLKDANTVLIGAMLNQVNPKRAARYEGGYYYRYGYYGNV